MYVPLISLLAQFPGKHQQTSAIRQTAKALLGRMESPPRLPVDTADEVSAVWDRLGPGSKEFLSDVTKWCLDEEVSVFTLDDIARSSGKSKADLKAHNRNVNRAMKQQGVRLWNTVWNAKMRHMTFAFANNAVLDGLYSLAFCTDARKSTANLR
jgi:hypothetical protein